MRSTILGNPSLAALAVAGVAVQERLGVVYGTTPQQTLELDLFVPTAGGGPRPGIVFVHGGGWSGGKREQFRDHAREAAARGYVTASVSYRLSGVAPYPAALDDCQLAVRWLRAHAAELGLDPARLGAMGSSAGGHLVACLGVRDTRNPEGEYADVSSRVDAVVDIHGVHDFAPPRDDSLLEQFMAASREEAPDRWRDASPLEHVDGDATPMLITHDPDDPVVPYDQSVRFAAALIEAARPVEFLPTPGSGHGFVYNLASPWAQRVWPVAMAWFDRWLR